MYRKDKCLALKSSVSAVSNNLSVYVEKGRSMLHYAVVYKLVVNLVHTSLDGRNVSHRQVISREPGSQWALPIVQARFVAFPSRVILVVTSCKGIQMFDLETAQMLYWYSLDDTDKSECFARGICNLQEDTICVGTSDGDILIFDIPSRGTNFTLSEQLRGHSTAIWELQSDKEKLVSSDDSGSIMIWSTGQAKMRQILVIPGYSYPCTSLALWNDLVIGGYGSGHLRVFSMSKGLLLAEVAAHAKWINAVDVAKSSGLLLSAGEDCFVRVWQLSPNHPQIEHRHNEYIANQQLQGAQFISPQGKAFGCTAYDSTEILFYMEV